VVRDEGVALSGYDAALASAARPYVEVAQRADRETEPVLVDVEKQVTVAIDTPGGARALQFKVDRSPRAQGGSS
jgi:hypothetical protein